MIIKKIEIVNFRSYYKSNTFDFIDGLNIIIGSNGDGKTTFYDALDWLFRTDKVSEMDAKLISKKRIEDLFKSESDEVKVSMTYEHKGVEKRLEKMFRFTKTFTGDVDMSNYSFTLTEKDGVERIVGNGIDFERDMPSEIRKYTMFKGEGDLDIFQTSNALKLLVETFSDVKDFEAYFSFMKFATDKADQARDHAQRNDTKNAQKIKVLTSDISLKKAALKNIQDELATKEESATTYSGLIKSIEKNKESSELLQSVNRRIQTLTENRAKAKSFIKENYTIDLLDNMWILMGFADVAQEYSLKVSEVDKKRRKIYQDHVAAVSADRLIKKLQTDFTPLPVHIPGQQIMQEMLDEEVCKICGRPAKKHSKEWNYMLQRLEDYKASLKNNSEEDIPSCYQNEYVVELQKRDTTLNDNLADITSIRRKIKDAIAFNNSRQKEIQRIDENLNQAYEEKKRILAQADGLSEDQLMANFENITNWMNQKNDAEHRIETLKRKREDYRANLEELQTELSKLAEGTTAALYARIALTLRNISDAFESAKESNKKRLLSAIEDEANTFLEKLNTNDFKGTIRILEKHNGQGEAVLMNNDNTRIFSPNTALRTTYLMSLLFAIGKLSGERDKTKFPLVFDAPTSSFTEAKESEFFNVIGTLNKQVIIVTKSFLKETDHNKVEMDYNKINTINGRVFRIKKQEPFDDKNLATIQTVISKIK